MATSLVLKGFKRLKKIFEPSSFEQRLKKHVKVATRKVGLLAVRKVKRDIRSRNVQPSDLSDFTIALKGSSKALVDGGDLRKAIISQLEDWDTVVVGVLRHRTVFDDNGNAADIMDVALAQHNGAEIAVSDKMRRFFFWLANSPQSPVRGRVKPLSQATKVIHIPARPFMKGIFDRKMRKLYNRTWQEAINKTLAGK